MQTDEKPLQGCPVEATLSVIGGKWKGMIIYHMTFDTGIIRYNEMQRRLPKITPRMLTKQLRELEEDGVIHREVYAQVPPKVEYSLTEFGRSLIPIVAQMEQWGIEFLENMSEANKLGQGSSKRVMQMLSCPPDSDSAD